MIGLHVRARQIASNPLGREPGLPGLGLTRLRPCPTRSACFSKYYPILSRCLQACGHQHDRRNHQRTDHGLSPVETAACTILPPPIPSQRCPGRFADTVYGVAGLPGLVVVLGPPSLLVVDTFGPASAGLFLRFPPRGLKRRGGFRAPDFSEMGHLVVIARIETSLRRRLRMKKPRSGRTLAVEIG